MSIEDLSINVSEINNIMIDKIKHKFKTYELILNKCYKVIRQGVNNCNNVVFFKVPEFVLGYPTYNIETCVIYLKTKLNSNGFFIKYIEPNHIMIYWTPPDEKEITDYIEFNNAIQNNTNIQYDINLNQNNYIENNKKTSNTAIMNKNNKFKSIMDYTPIKKFT